MFGFWCCFSLFIVLAGAPTRSRAADWSNTIAAATFGNDLYTIEKAGALYRTDLRTGKWQQVGKADFASTRMLIAGPKNLFTIETNGSLYRVSPLDGSWSGVGKTG